MTTYTDIFIFTGCLTVLIFLHVAIAHFTDFFDVREEVDSFEKFLFFVFFIFTPFFNFLFAIFIILPLYFWLGNNAFEWTKRKIILYKNPEIASLELLEQVLNVYRISSHTFKDAINQNIRKDSTHTSKGIPDDIFNTLLPFIKKNRSKTYVSSTLKEYESSFANILAVIEGSENTKLEHRVAILTKYKNTLKVFQERIQTMKDKDFAIEGKIGEMSLTRILDELDKETHIHQKNLSKLNSSLNKNGS